MLDMSTQTSRIDAGRNLKRMKRSGYTIEEMAMEVKDTPGNIQRWLNWAEQYVPDAPEDTITARQAEIAKLNEQEIILRELWSSLEVKTLRDFQLYNREMVELSKARRALGGLDAPVRVEQKIETTTHQPDSIDAEVAKLARKLGVSPPKAVDSDHG